MTNAQRSNGCGFGGDKRAAFTLSELLVVVAIIDILAAITIPPATSSSVSANHPSATVHCTWTSKPGAESPNLVCS